MKTLTCFCDQMFDRTKSKFGHESMLLSWDCPEHGKITADFRSVSHHHPPAYTPGIQIGTSKPKHPQRRVGCP